MVLLLFTSHLALSSSTRLRFIEAQDLVHGKQNNLLKLDEIEKADRTRLDYLFGVIDKAETNGVEEDLEPERQSTDLQLTFTFTYEVLVVLPRNKLSPPGHRVGGQVGQVVGLS
ncbi:unnamed protein product [Brassica oleracea]